MVQILSTTKRRAQDQSHPRQWVVRFRSFLQPSATPRINPTHGSGWFVSDLSTTKRHARSIPPTAVGGWFRSFLQPSAAPTINPTHGSGWMGSNPFYNQALRSGSIPPTAVGGWVQILSTTKRHAQDQSHPRQWVDGFKSFLQPSTRPTINPTHGSGWMVQILSRLALTGTRTYSALMYLTPLKTLTWAYQLHYYLCFRTHRRSRSLPSIEPLLKTLVYDICERHDYRLLALKSYPTQLRIVVSLRPNQAIAKVIQTIKTNTSRESKLRPRLWARGYLAQSVGRVRVNAVRKYLEQQSTHHGYDLRWLPPVYRYRCDEPLELSASHAVFDLSHHLVFSTRWRRGIFSSGVGRALTDYWLRVAAKRRFAIDQVSTIPDHIHLIVRIVPSMSIEECALLLMNNGQYFMAKNFPQLLIQARIDQLWQSSAYAGTCGRYTTGLMQRWLRSE